MHDLWSTNGERIGGANNASNLASSPKRAPYVVGAAGAQQSLDGTTTSDPFGWVEANLQEGDLLLLPGIEAARAALARSPDIIGKRFLVAVASATRH